MGTFRAFLRENRRAAAFILALAVAVKAMMPAGYMLAPQAQVLTVHVCADTQGAQLTKRIIIPHAGAAQENQRGDTGSDQRCAFSTLAFGSLAGTDPILLSLALAFVLLLGFAPAREATPSGTAYLRPPLRGPPARV